MSSLFPRPVQAPARRAGQVQRDDAPYMPEQTQGQLESMENMRQLLNDRNRELQKLQDAIAVKNAEIQRLAGLATADIIYRHESVPRGSREHLYSDIEKVRAYVKGLRIWGTEDKAQICTDILYIIGEN